MEMLHERYYDFMGITTSWDVWLCVRLSILYENSRVNLMSCFALESIHNPLVIVGGFSELNPQHVLLSPKHPYHWI